MRAAVLRFVAFLALALVIAYALVRRADGPVEGGAAPTPTPTPTPSALAPDAGPPPYAADPDGCAVVFEEGEAHFETAAVALAAATCSPSLRGHDARALRVTTSLAFGAPALLEDAGLAGAVVARIAADEDPASACGAMRGAIAILSLRGPRLEIDAIGDWTSGCGALEPLGVEETRGEVVLVETIEGEPDAADVDAAADPPRDEPVQTKRVWTRRGRALAAR